MEKPKYTLLYDITSIDGFTARCRAFFKDARPANDAFNSFKIGCQNPLLRSYSPMADRKYLVDYQKPSK